MTKTKTTGAIALDLAPPPEGGGLSVTTSLEEDAHYLRVTLDKSENFKVAAGERLRDLLINKFANNRNALRDWYEDNVVQGKVNRTWNTVEPYLGVVLRHGVEAAPAIFAERDARDRNRSREYQRSRSAQLRGEFSGDKNVNDNNDLGRDETTFRRAPPSEYEQRRAWLSDMNHLWFKGSREWQDRWLQDRDLSRGKRRHE